MTKETRVSYNITAMVRKDKRHVTTPSNMLLLPAEGNFYDDYGYI
jgi:hypothetical protein